MQSQQARFLVVSLSTIFRSSDHRVTSSLQCLNGFVDQPTPRLYDGPSNAHSTFSARSTKCRHDLFSWFFKISILLKCRRRILKIQSVKPLYTASIKPFMPRFRAIILESDEHSAFGVAMSHHPDSNLETQLQDLREQQRRLKDTIRQKRDAQRRSRDQRRADLGLQSIDRPRRGNKFTSTLTGEKVRQTTHLRVSILQNVQRIARDANLSLSEAIDNLLDTALQLPSVTGPKPSTSNRDPSRGTEADFYDTEDGPSITTKSREGDLPRFPSANPSELSPTLPPRPRAKYRF